MDPTHAEHVLECLRRSMKLSVGVVQYLRADGAEVWRVDAASAGGERWAAEHEDYGRAVVMLAELVGFDLMDG